MDPRGGDSAAPASSLGGAEKVAAWLEDADTPAEARWRRSRILGRYEDFLRASVDWVWETDAERVLCFVSAPVASKLGIPAQALIGRPLLSLGRFTQSSQASGPAGPLGVLRPFRDAHFIMKGDESREVAYRLSGVPYFHDEDGRFGGFRGTATALQGIALQAREMQEAELSALSRALEEALLQNADLKGRLAAVKRRPAPPEPPEPLFPAAGPTAPADTRSVLKRTAHELRTPLNAVIGYADLGLSEIFGPLGERYLDCLRTIREAGRHMDSLIAQLQSSIQQPSQAGPAVEIVDIAAVVAKAKAMIALAARNAGIDISRVGPMVGGRVLGDQRACVQILLNLLSNAVKFTPPGGSVGVETVAGPAGTLQIVVWDSGTGISIEEQARIFEPEFRAAEVRADAMTPGHGLGLAIARDLARAMGGDLTFISQPGQGSRFILTLPIAGPDTGI
jgi:signal transduction histidine kinase